MCVLFDVVLISGPVPFLVRMKAVFQISVSKNFRERFFQSDDPHIDHCILDQCFSTGGNLTVCWMGCDISKTRLPLVISMYASLKELEQ